ncbi:MAG: phosphate signaling complex protein PhoU [Gammaproteobacteria bacterium]|nr:phosphate signaling complex protein PhoU [Gammaproteobacteria bacterium]NIR84040.1 phosphate signaling complex protein PhoU [Gammaproteobacteria bacterium]NIR89184.1 phosphate signaling complex protein PhoU [Gammaproteobacteria bacterium]NIU04986.1 phosphate signaling complex protein PhoU [Gammaproteobacteria bacterium]NIV52152.1 phosphate signaling complex protein PhoU [Gammaproteobacteria bacterium]
MEEMGFRHHISRQFNAELEDVRNKVLSMGGLVEKQLADATAALMEGDSERGEKVVTSDYKINALEVAIDEECSRILARRQPAASDLRLLVSVIKTITDLERMGDEAERIGRMAVQLAGREGWSPNHTALPEIRHLGNDVKEMLHEALDAFARTDVELAARVVEKDRQADKEYEAIIRQLITFMMEDPRSIPRSLEVMWAARALERIGDRACNICEYVIYFVKGRDVRHTSLEQVQREAREPK